MNQSPNMATACIGNVSCQHSIKCKKNNKSVPSISLKNLLHSLNIRNYIKSITLMIFSANFLKNAGPKRIAITHLNVRHPSAILNKDSFNARTRLSLQFLNYSREMQFECLNASTWSVLRAMMNLCKHIFMFTFLFMLAVFILSCPVCG